MLRYCRCCYCCRVLFTLVIYIIVVLVVVVCHTSLVMQLIDLVVVSIFCFCGYFCCCYFGIYPSWQHLCIFTLFPHSPHLVDCSQSPKRSLTLHIDRVVGRCMLFLPYLITFIAMSFCCSFQFLLPFP